jgi:uncharacterized OB-fold protein
VAVASIGTYLPPWVKEGGRLPGDDEDAVTLAVAAGLGALRGTTPPVERVVFVTRDFPLVEAGNAAALVAGLGLDPGVEVVECLGGAPALLEAMATASGATLVIGADVSPSAGAGALVVTRDDRDAGVLVTVRGWVHRSVPVLIRDGRGCSRDYGDPRLLRERGLRASLAALGFEGPVAGVAGCDPRDIPGAGRDTVRAPTGGASAAVFALAALVERGGGALVAADQATVALADVGGGSVAIHRDEKPVGEPPALRPGPEAEISISLAAYERAFDGKLRFEAVRCRDCGALAYPRRFRCISCGSEQPGVAEPLPRDATVHSTTTVHVPVPGLCSPYTLVLVELGDSGVRFLTRLTGAPPGRVAIGNSGRMVFRRLAVRSGVPDYGYAFRPEV